MKFLAIDTTMEKIGIALYIDGKEYLQKIDAKQKKHNSTLLPFVDNLLTTSGIAVKDIDIFGVVNGPGSFTGIRVGVATINGLAFALNKKVVEITSLELVRIDNNEEDILALIDCKHGNFYGALFQGEEAEYKALSAEEIEKYNIKKIYSSDVNPVALLKAMIQKIERGEFVERAKPFYLKKSSAERENEI